jgi:hypothetical protein
MTVFIFDGQAILQKAWLVFYTVSPILGLSSDFGWSDEFQ